MTERFQQLGYLLPRFDGQAALMTVSPGTATLAMAEPRCFRRGILQADRLASSSCRWSAAARLLGQRPEYYMQSFGGDLSAGAFAKAAHGGAEQLACPGPGAHS